jgi:ABC-type glutathione transport system ATPase component
VTASKHNSPTFAHRDNGQELYLRFAHLSVEIPSTTGRKTLIDDVTAHAVSGRVLAIMGPSGSGKTTTLNALSGRATYAKVLSFVINVQVHSKCECALRFYVGSAATMQCVHRLVNVDSDVLPTF